MNTKILILSFLFIHLLSHSKAQTMNVKDTISYTGSAWTKESFVYNGIEIEKPQDIFIKLNTNEQSKNYFKRANFNKKLSKVCSAIGGLCLGVGAIDILSGKNFNSTLFISGAGLTLVSLPLTSKYFKNMKKSVYQYNRQ